MATFEVNEKGQVVAILTPKEQQRALRAQRLGYVATVAPTAKVYKTKADIKAGNGFPCTAVPPCKRTDLRTAKNAAVHATTQKELADLGHSPDKAPLPKA